MNTNSFLYKLSHHIIYNLSVSTDNVTIILPSKRAKIFLTEALKNTITKTIIAPEIISIEDFIQEVSQIRSLDAIEVLFQFYEVYTQIEKNPEEFELFANWGKILLQDFNEIDRYLLDPDKILKYLENIKEIEHWAVDVDKRTEMIEKHLLFWKKLPHYYHTLYAHLLKSKKGYQGLIYREAKKNIESFAKNTTKTYLFAGFNALNKAEEHIFQQMLLQDKARVFWDIDEAFLNDPFHDAGLFARKIKSEWKYYKNHPFEWINNTFSEEKNIQIIATPKNIGQTKLVGSIINDISTNNIKLENTAVILGDENLLLPILYSLPEAIGNVNITMGYSSKNNPIQLFVDRLFKMHTNAVSRQGKQYVFYYKDVLDVLHNPLTTNLFDAEKLSSLIKRNNFTYFSHQTLFDLFRDRNDFFELVFAKWDSSSLDILERINAILLKIKSALDYSKEEDEKITNAFVYSIYLVINKLINYYTKNIFSDKIETLYQVYKQVVDIAEVSFEGEPLEGLQIMGVLESRTLDFETVIITSVNEGKFPSGKSNNSFIPYDVKREYGLPTYKEKDAIYTYHFYHLLQRAKNIYLIYNIDSDGFESGEKSRFITQLEVEKKSKHTITHHLYNAMVPAKVSNTMLVEKTESILARLQEMAQEGFSPSTLTTYLRNPIQFYFQRILRIKEVDEVEENIAVNTLGTIIHGALEVLYTPYIGKILIEKDVTDALLLVEQVVFQKFKEIYKEGEIKKGKNLLAFEVAKRNVINFLKYEIEQIKNGDQIQIIALEETFERVFEHKNISEKIIIKGNVDRIENRNGTIRIIDYKTGKVEQKDVTLTQWENLLKDSKYDKIIQILAYAFMYSTHTKGLPIEAGIISFKNLKSGFLPFTFKEDKISTTIISDEIMDSYLDQIAILINELFDLNIPFTEKEN